MSYWDSQTQRVIRFDPLPYNGYPGWLMVDCGCCNGLEWGGEYPRECKTCGGAGRLAEHTKSGALAWYPGGPLCGRA